jgi:hypothetical protein
MSLWSAVDGKPCGTASFPKRPTKGPTGFKSECQVRAVAFSPDGRECAALAEFSALNGPRTRVTVWDMATGRVREDALSIGPVLENTRIGADPNGGNFEFAPGHPMFRCNYDIVDRVSAAAIGRVVPGDEPFSDPLVRLLDGEHVLLMVADKRGSYSLTSSPLPAMDELAKAATAVRAPGETIDAKLPALEHTQSIRSARSALVRIARSFLRRYAAQRLTVELQGGTWAWPIHKTCGIESSLHAMRE